MTHVGIILIRGKEKPVFSYQTSVSILIHIYFTLLSKDNFATLMLPQMYDRLCI